MESRRNEVKRYRFVTLRDGRQVKVGFMRFGPMFDKGSRTSSSTKVANA